MYTNFSYDADFFLNKTLNVDLDFFWTKSSKNIIKSVPLNFYILFDLI